MTLSLETISACTRIGVIGGTFNPIHFGHLRSAEEIREQFQLDKVIFVPGAIPPHKNDQAITSPEDRLHMVHLAVDKNPHFVVSDFELARERTSYTIFMIEHFRELIRAEAELFFLMGIDAFIEIAGWKDYARLFSLTNLIIMSRPGFPEKRPEDVLPVDVACDFDYNPSDKFYEHSSGRRLYFRKITLLEISSRAIRTLIKEGKSVRYLLPPEVHDYAHSLGLFKG